MMLNPLWRKILLTTHIITSVGFMGSVGSFLALAVVGVTADDVTARGIYLALPIITTFTILPLAIASLAFGIVQSLGTSWGLFVHYWIVIKLALTIAAIWVLLLQVENIDTLARAAARGGELPAALLTTRVSMLIHSAGGLAVLTVATVLSVFRPRGTIGRNRG